MLIFDAANPVVVQFDKEAGQTRDSLCRSERDTSRGSPGFLDLAWDRLFAAQRPLQDDRQTATLPQILAR